MTWTGLAFMALVVAGASGCATAKRAAPLSRADCECCAPPGLRAAHLSMAAARTSPTLSQTQKGISHVH
jgi:hypothetical protein